MSVLVVILVTAISLFCRSNPADAAAEGLPAGVVLEAGQIDSSTVTPGGSVVVVYGLGYRNPVSGEWLRLTTARGTVQAVDEKRLLLALEGRDSLQRIDLERIQTLVLTGSAATEPEELANTQDDERLEAMADRENHADTSDSREIGKRIVRKLGAGILVGTLAGSALAKLFVGDGFDQEGDGIGEYSAAIYGGLIGYTAGLRLA